MSNFKPNDFQRREKKYVPRANEKIRALDVQVIDSSGNNLGVLPLKKAIETAISDLRNALKGTDTEEVKKKTQSLIQASMKLGEAVYKSQQKPADKTGGNNDDKKDNKEKENVVDAEVVDSKEDKEKRA